MNSLEEQFKTYQNVFNDFITKTDTMVHTLNGDVIENQNKVVKYKALIMQKDNHIQKLNTKIKKITAEEEICKRKLDEIATTIKNLRNYSRNVEIKYKDLEIKYEATVAEKQLELLNFTEAVENLQLKISELERKKTAQSIEMDALNTKYVHEVSLLATTNSKLTQNLNDKCLVLEIMQKDSELLHAEKQKQCDELIVEQRNITIAYENEIQSLKQELSKVQAELQESETSKNKIIEEQRFKIREIERALENPIVPVAANNTTKTIGIVHSVRNEQVIQISDTEKNVSSLPKYNTRKRRQPLTQATNAPLLKRGYRIYSTSSDESVEDNYYIDKFQSSAYNFMAHKNGREVKNLEEKLSNENAFDLLKIINPRSPIKENGFRFTNWSHQ